MKEYKFRGKSTVCGYWVYGDHLKNDNKTYIISEFEDLCGEQDVCDTIDYYEVHPETVGQYTGLKDENGKEIYEGDIIQIPGDYDVYGMNAGEIYEIYFKYGGFRLKPKYGKSKGFWLEDDGVVQILGNIHENLELLEEI